MEAERKFCTELRIGKFDAGRNSEMLWTDITMGYWKKTGGFMRAFY